ncbi:DUF7848 domain-containing protein [Streptomyces chrestomyceticus]|uniref:DUF7848 domain-containing protein n=1 Tax=Streptomyces chrestomyceticus TaxID=68185 RepID=UPI0033E971E7
MGAGSAPSAALNRPSVTDASTAAASPEAKNLEIQLSGKRHCLAECRTGTCTERSATWMSPLPAQEWARAHKRQTGHSAFYLVDRSEVSVVPALPKGPQNR